MEYAVKAVENSGTIVGIRGKDGVVFGVEKLVLSKLYEFVLCETHERPNGALALVKGIREPHEVKKKFFYLGGNRTHDHQIRS